MKDIEKWKTIQGWEQYEVSNSGRVRSKDRVIKQRGHKNEYQRVMSGHILKARLQNNGYLLVWLSNGGKKKAMTIHRLVASAFLGFQQGMGINHKDGNKKNNNINNLEWVSRSENIKHAYNVLGRVRNSCKVMCAETGEIFD